MPEDEAGDDGEPDEEGNEPVLVLRVEDQPGDPPAADGVISRQSDLDRSEFLALWGLGWAPEYEGDRKRSSETEARRCLHGHDHTNSEVDQDANEPSPPYLRNCAFTALRITNSANRC